MSSTQVTTIFLFVCGLDMRIDSTLLLCDSTRLYPLTLGYYMEDSTLTSHDTPYNLLHAWL